MAEARESPGGAGPGGSGRPALNRAVFSPQGSAGTASHRCEQDRGGLKGVEAGAVNGGHSWGSRAVRVG